MSLKDSIEFMKQGNEYEEETVESNNNTDSSSNVIDNSSDTSIKRRKKDNPFKKDGYDSVSKKPILTLIGITIAIGVIASGSYFAYKKATEDKGADWLQEMEDGVEEAPFKYSADERSMLRVNGFTADDIERLEIEERDPYQAVKKAEQDRKEKYDKEIKPYLDGASEEFNTLKEQTWLGTGTMSEKILDMSEHYSKKYGTYNCDYEKIPAYGSQLFLKLELDDFDTNVFMTVTSEKYQELQDSGNIVVTIYYNLYDDNSILVTDIKEKNIRE